MFCAFAENSLTYIMYICLMLMGGFVFTATLHSTITIEGVRAPLCGFLPPFRFDVSSVRSFSHTQMNFTLECTELPRFPTK